MSQEHFGYDAGAKSLNMVNSRKCGRRGILDRECFQWMNKIRDYKYHRRNKCSQASIICDGRKSSILEALVKNIVMRTLEGDDVMKTGLREKQRNVRHGYQIQSSKMKVWGSLCFLLKFKWNLLFLFPAARGHILKLRVPLSS